MCQCGRLLRRRSGERIGRFEQTYELQMDSADGRGRLLYCQGEWNHARGEQPLRYAEALCP